MMKVSLLEFFIRAIPEAFLFLYATYALSKTVVNKNKYLISSILFLIIIFIIRQLPINFGVHTIIFLFVLIVISVSINNIDVTKSIKASIMAVILQFICEGINVFIIQYIFRLNLNVIFKNPLAKTLYGIPSTIIFAVIIILYYCILTRRNEMRDV